jgi:SSS family solute:Na+ symporter
MTLLILTIYLGVVLAIGLFSQRLFRGTGQDYFLATRTIGPFVLLMSLFGTNMTAFSLLGASGEAYRSGIGVFALMASSTAIVGPVLILFLATRLWATGKRLNLLTQAQYIRARYDSDALGLLLFVVLVALVVPYLLIGVMGGGLTLNQISGGQIPSWVGGLVISTVVMIYVTAGGLRGTAWANTFQTLVFMLLGSITMIYIVRQLGGLEVAFNQLAASRPDLLVRGEHIPALKMLSYTLIPLSAGMFPHIFMHWLSARRAEAFRMSIVAYPICIMLVWVPSVTLGVLGHNSFDGLEGAAANSILIRMIDYHAPDVLAGLLGAGVLAAVMSSLDSQVLSVGNMFTQDIVRHYGFHDQMSEKNQVLVGRLFVGGILLLTFLISLITPTRIFGLAIWTFSSFASLAPILLAAIFWRRSTKAGAFTAVITVVILWVYFFSVGWNVPNYTVGGTGVMPVGVVLLASSVAVVMGSLLSRPPSDETLAQFFS